MMVLRILILMFCLVWGGVASAQFWKSKKNAKTEHKRQRQEPNSVNPYFPQIDYGPQAKFSKKASKGITYDAQANFYKRVEEVSKQRRKTEKEIMKPQYSDPSYFGHKRKPKKRKPSKMKFCKVCGIRH